MKLIEKDTPGQRIADLCKDYGISQKELAEKIGLSENAIKGLVTETIDVEILNHLLENPAQKAEAKHDICLLNAQKFDEHEAEIERMKNIFMSILREIKGDIDSDFYLLKHNISPFENYIRIADNGCNDYYFMVI